MAECTPGPWTIEEYGDEEAPALVIHKDSGTRVCFMATAGSHGDPARIEADAHLIAAAPDLLGALRFVLAFYEPGQRYLDTNAWKLAEAEARAAVAKATGS